MRLSLLLLSLMFFSCSLFDKQEQEPSYIEVNETNVKVPGSETFVSSGIKDVWVFLDGANLGIYSPPTHIACLPQTEIPELSLLGGIRENGIASELVTYPMLLPYTQVKELKAGEILEINPVFEYRNDLFKRFDEGFEIQGHIFTFDADGDENTNLEISSDIKRSGSNSGFMKIDSLIPAVEIASSPPLIGVPDDGSAVYLEIDYLSDANLFVGLIGYEDPEGLSSPLKSFYLGLKPTTEWKKIYINFTSEFVNSALPSYRLVLRAEHSGSTGEERCHIDNVKLLHF